ncbi:MAG: lipopolysaccharide biosynthesis protein [Gemmatimonadaceae bacterium]
MRNSLTLLSGTVATQLVAALSAPLLARLYAPRDYGALGLFMALAGLLTVVASLQMSTAIVLPRRDSAGRSLLYLSVGMTLAICAAVTPIVVLSAGVISRAIGAPSLEIWLPWLPVAAALSSTAASLNAYANRLQLYRAMSASRLSGAIVGVVISLWLGFTWRNSFGLFAGFFAGLVVTNAVLFIAARSRDADLLSRAHRKRLIGAFYRYRNFARVATPAAVLNNVVQQLPLYMISTVSGATNAGLYSMTNRLLGLPGIFISSAVSEVFRQRASADYANTGSCRNIYVKTGRTLALLGVLPLLALFLFGPDIFALYLGEPWRTAGEFARILAPLYFMRFVISPLSYVFYIADRQVENLLAQFAMLAVSGGGLYLGHYLTGSTTGMLALYSTGYSLIYLYYAIRGYVISSNNPT